VKGDKGISLIEGDAKPNACVNDRLSLSCRESGFSMVLSCSAFVLAAGVVIDVGIAEMREWMPGA